MAQTLQLKTAALWIAAMVIAAACSWTFFTGWGVTAAYVGSHTGMVSDAEIQQARIQANAFFAGLLCAQVLLFWCGAKFMAVLARDRHGVIPSLRILGLGIAAGAVTDVLVIGILLLRQIEGAR